MTQFEYVAVLVSIIVGLALAQILWGVGRMVTADRGPRPYWIHLVWTLYFFLLTVLFWWWEFRLNVVDWSLTIYLVVIVYATLLFFVSVVVQPGAISHITDYREYFYSKRRWIFGLFVATWLWDFVDTLAKGATHFSELGSVYVATNATQMSFAVVAMFTTNERFHGTFAVLCLTVLVTFQFRTFFIVS